MYQEAKIPREAKVREAKVPFLRGDKSTGRQKFPEAKEPGRRKFLFSGEAKVPGGKCTRRQKFPGHSTSDAYFLFSIFLYIETFKNRIQREKTKIFHLHDFRGTLKFTHFSLT